MRTDDACAWFNIGLTHEKEGHASEAGNAFIESFKSYHRNLSTHALQAGGKMAVKVCQRMTEIDPKDAKAWINLGAALGQAEQPNEEIDAYRKAIQLAPKYAEAWYNLGVAQARREEDVEAIQAYKQALLLSPKFAKAWFNLGVLQGKLGNPHEKVRSYRQAVEADPNFGEAWHNLGVILNAVGKQEEGSIAFICILCAGDGPLRMPRPPRVYLLPSPPGLLFLLGSLPLQDSPLSSIPDRTSMKGGKQVSS